MQREECFQIVNNSEEMFLIAKHAISVFLRDTRVDNFGRWTASRVEMCHHDLENTYLIRIFAEFEGILRDYWISLGRKNYPKMMDLVNSISNKRRMPDKFRDLIHEVRE